MSKSKRSVNFSENITQNSTIIQISSGLHRSLAQEADGVFWTAGEAAIEASLLLVLGIAWIQGHRGK